MNQLFSGIRWMLDMITILATMPDELMMQLKKTLIELGSDLGAGL